MLFPAHRRNESLTAIGFQMSFYIFYKSLQRPQLALETLSEEQAGNATCTCMRWCGAAAKVMPLPCVGLHGEGSFLGAAFWEQIRLWGAV